MLPEQPAPEGPSKQAVPPRGDVAKPSLSSHLPSLFQLWMALCGCFELPSLYALLYGKVNVVDLTPWFDRRSYHTKNPALAYLYATMLLVLVITRMLVCYRPELVMLVLYAAAVHWLEVAFFVVVLGAKQDWGHDAVKGTDPTTFIYVIMSIAVFNPAMLTFRFFSLQSSLRRQEVENVELRRRQLTEIRRRRAEYKRKKLEEKTK